jgi:hypothetical protein
VKEGFANGVAGAEIVQRGYFEGRMRAITYGAVVRSSFLLRMGSDIVSGVMCWDSRFFDPEKKTRVWVESTVAANICRELASALDLGEDYRLCWSVKDWKSRSP